MKKTKVLMIAAIGLLAVQLGCGGKDLAKTGFLSDYSKLRAETDNKMMYINKTALDSYSSFIVDRVDLHLYSEAKARKEMNKGKITDQDIADLTNYMHSAIVKAIQDAGKKIAHKPGSGVARLRTALTDIESSHMISILPQASLLKAGIGGASMEAEVVDSQTGQQIGAVIQSGKGSRIPFTNLGEWTATKQAIDSWAKKLQERLE
ncbi:MAG: DUF3313 domain-containing protein [Planctomycetota bacterium]